MAESVIYIVDDIDASVEYLCPSTHQTVTQSYFRKTWTSIASSGCDDGWFSYAFNGTRVKISAGITRWAQGDYSVQLDGDKMLLETGDGAYDSGQLADGLHTVTYAMGNTALFPAFDYLTVTAGESTAMKGRTVMLDDTNSAIQYSGKGWTTHNLTKATFDYSTGPYLDTAHWTNTIGDSFQVSFVGDSVAVYGILTDTTSDGNFTLEYTLDDGAIKEVVYLANTTIQPIPMARLFQVDLDAGKHVLTVNITDVINSYPIAFDFVAYNASYNSITDMYSTSSSGGTGSSHKSTHIGAIVGGVVGGLVFVALCGLFFYITKKRTQRQQRTRAAATVIGRNYNPQLGMSARLI
ncbi:hypothetical protein CPB85DRAFT_1218513 [Mucidula mucida]|nr:hypothetical protein CPB85DRAFT_1218513 [Mucidula mucida]